jgi:hypothetical protein
MQCVTAIDFFPFLLRNVLNLLSLQELATENRLLKTLQKRQGLALSKYEGAKAMLPQLIRSHNEEVRVLTVNIKHVSIFYEFSSTIEYISIYTLSKISLCYILMFFFHNLTYVDYFAKNHILAVCISAGTQNPFNPESKL